MRTRLRQGLLCAFVFGVGSVHAETEDFFDLSPDDLSKLKVTAASAFAESSLDSSATVSVVQRADWEQRGARNLPDAVMHLPGVMLLQPPAGGKLIQVRSYDSTSLRGRATLIDGVPINTFAFGSEVFSNSELQLPVFESLELVRGPSSILYGSDAFHSAILLSSYHTTVPFFEVGGSVGSNDYEQAAVRGTTLFGDSQSLQTAISATHQGDQNQQYHYHPIGGTIANGEREQSYDAGTALLRWEGKATAIGHSLELFVDKTNANELTGGGTAAGDTRNHDVADHNAELWLLKGQLDGELGAGWGWRLDGYYWRNDYGQRFALPASAAATIFFEDSQQFVEHRKGTSLRLTQPKLAVGSTVSQIAVTAGYEQAGIDDHDNHRSLLSGGPIAQPTLDYSGLGQSIHSVSMEGKTRWSEDRWQLIYGGRLDDYSTFGEQTSPRLGLIWIPASSYSIKALYGRAFRAPNANELLGTNFFAGDTNLKPETLDSYELALTYAQGPWHAEAVGFESRWHDRIILGNDPTAPRGRRYANIGESESRGVELLLNYRHDDWRIEISASRISNRNLDTDRSSQVFPEWILNIGGGYSWPEYRLELFVANRLHENVDIGDPVANQTLPQTGTFFRTDVTLKQEWTPQLTGRVVVRNLFDRDNVWPGLVNNVDGVADIERQLALEIEYRPK